MAGLDADLNKSGIYQIKNLVNGLIYIGSAVNFRKRWNFHKWQLNKNIHESKHLQNSWNKYGEVAFQFKILECCSIHEMQVKEQFWLDWTQCFNPKIGYNICRDVVKGRLGLKSSPEHIAKIVKANTGKKKSEAQKEMLRSLKLGSKLTEEQKQARRDYRHSEVAKNKISKSLKGNSRGLSYKHTSEAIKKISDASKKRFNRPLILDGSKRIEVNG